MKNQRWSNWSGRVQCNPAKIFAPTCRKEIKNIVEAVDGTGRTVRVAGAGHSFTNLVGTGDCLISLDDYSGVVETSLDSLTATVRAGTTLSELGPALFERNMAMENIGDIDEQSLAGAISTGTHGTGSDFGILSTQLDEIEFISPAEGLVKCSRENKPEVFRAAQVSLGTLGILTELKLNLEPAYHLHELTRRVTLDECLSSITTLRENNRHFEFFWFPNTKTALLKTLNKTKKRSDVPDWTYGESLENYAFGTLCNIGTSVNSLVPFMNRLSARGAGETNTVGPSYKVFSTMREVRFNEMEYGVPADKGPEVFRHLKDWIESQHSEVQFPLEFRYVKGDKIPLSPAYGGDRVFIALHKYHKKPYESYFRGAEEIFKQYNGRPHWGKIHYRSQNELRELYPEWESFNTIRERFDPAGVFVNDHISRIFDET